jgi:hypothetical protein
MTTVPPDDKPIREDLLDDLARLLADEVRDEISRAEAGALGPVYDAIREIAERIRAEQAERS